MFFFFFKQKTAYEMRISDWSSDVCSSDLRTDDLRPVPRHRPGQGGGRRHHAGACALCRRARAARDVHRRPARVLAQGRGRREESLPHRAEAVRSEEHTSELQSLMRISYAVFCLKKKKKKKTQVTLQQLIKH